MAAQSASRLLGDHGSARALPVGVGCPQGVDVPWPHVPPIVCPEARPSIRLPIPVVTSPCASVYGKLVYPSSGLDHGKNEATTLARVAWKPGAMPEPCTTDWAYFWANATRVEKSSAMSGSLHLCVGNRT